MHDIINYSTSICPFESGKSGKEEEKIQKFEYLENKKRFLDEIKKHFSQFLKGYHSSSILQVYFKCNSSIYIELLFNLLNYG